MKRLFVYTMLLICAVSFTSCSKEDIDDDKDYDFTPAPITAVDLNLSKKWCNMNVGAVSPEDYGKYYAWAEITADKSSYDWGNYKYGRYWNQTTKYPGVDERSILEPEDDAATMNLGSQWETPTEADWQELIDKCKWVWTTGYGVNSIPGYIVYKMKDTDNYTLEDTHIFLPAAGYYNGTKRFVRGSYGHYWSSTLKFNEEEYCSKGKRMLMTKDKIEISAQYKCYGQSVRAVLKNQ